MNAMCDDGRFVRTALLLGTIIALGACSSQPGSDARAATRGQDQAVPVTVAAVVQRDVPVQLRVIGNVEPYSTVSLKPQIEGQVAEVRFEEGQQVHKGDLLFRIDPRPFEAALRQAEANLAKDTAEARNASVEAGRRARLLKEGFVSNDENDQAQTRAASLQATVKADQAAVENAKLQLQYCYIRSPLDGRVGRVLVHAGNVVKSNETMLAVINQLRPAYVTFSVPEQQLPEIRARTAHGKLAVDAFVPHVADPITGELSFIDNTVDTNTGTVLLKALFANQDEALWPGQFVDVALTLRVDQNAILVPAEAIQTGQQGPYVFVITPDLTADVRPVVVGRAAGQQVVVTQGVQPGEQVVTEGQVRLAAGVKVEIKNAGPSTPSAPHA